MLPRALACVLLTALLAVSTLGHAQTPAEKLFEQGLQDMLDGKYETGCPALEESYQLEPLPGALFTLAECKNKWGKLQQASTHYRDYLDRVSRMSDKDKAEQGDRPDVAREQADALDARIPKLTLNAPDDRPSGLRVTRNGEPVLDASLGLPLPVDPGEHVIVTESPRHERREERIRLEEGDRRTITVSMGRDTGGSSSGDMRTAAYIAGGVGVVGLLIGIIAGSVALSEKGTIDDECNADNQCTRAGLDAVDTGQAAGTASTVGFIIGAVGLTAGLTLFLVSLGGDDGGGDGADTTAVTLGVAAGPGSIRLDLHW